jgi:hypothetical protein
VLSRVAADHRPVIVRRDGADLAAVVPLELLAAMQDTRARQEAERIAARVDWKRAVAASPPPLDWHAEEEPKPF